MLPAESSVHNIPEVGYSLCEWYEFCVRAATVQENHVQLGEEQDEVQQHQFDGRVNVYGR